MQLFGDVDILSFVRISGLNWIGRANRRDSKRKVSQVLNNILEDDQKTDGGIVYKHILINAKLQLEKEIKNTAYWKKSIKEVKVHNGL